MYSNKVKLLAIGELIYIISIWKYLDETNLMIEGDSIVATTWVLKGMISLKMSNVSDLITNVSAKVKPIMFAHMNKERNDAELRINSGIQNPTYNDVEAKINLT